MKKILQYLLLGIFLLIGLSYLYLKYFTIEDGEQAPDFETTLVDGTPFRLSDLHGQYVLLDFWGSWCAPCLRESPQLVSIYDSYANNLVIVTIALEKNDKTWRKAADKFGFVWKHQIVEENQFVLMSSIARKYGVTEIPAKFLISPNGELMGRYSLKKIDSLFSSKK